MNAVISKRLQCRHCSRNTGMREADARNCGWRIWRGTTLGGQEREDIVCPSCGGTRPGEQLAPEPSWRVGCRTCDWE